MIFTHAGAWADKTENKQNKERSQKWLIRNLKSSQRASQSRPMWLDALQTTALAMVVVASTMIAKLRVCGNLPTSTLLAIHIEMGCQQSYTTTIIPVNT